MFPVGRVPLPSLAREGVAGIEEPDALDHLLIVL